MALYPPVVVSSMTVFDITKALCTVYFSLPRYMGEEQLRQQLGGQTPFIQFTVRRQDNNASILSNASDIAINNFNNLLNRRTELDIALGRYPVTFAIGENSKGDIIIDDKDFEANTNYKIQMRFCGDVNSQGATNAESIYSQWSTVCLVRGVYPPDFYINEFRIVGPVDTQINLETGIVNGDFQYYNTFADFSAFYKVNYRSPSQQIKSWRLRLLNSNYTPSNIYNIKNYTLGDSGQHFLSYNNYTTLGKNDQLFLNCPIPYQFQQDKTYRLLFQIETHGGLKLNKLYQFDHITTSIDGISYGYFETSVNEEQGYIRVSYKNGESFDGNIVLRRSDSRSNFLKWEDLKFFTLEDYIDFTYYDLTAQSGLIYKYLIQKVDIRGRRGIPKISSEIIVQYKHPFLLETTGNGDIHSAKQLKLKYNFQISSYKTNVFESKTDTLGSKYPFIRRNGDVYYRSFSLTGTIASLMDDASLFVTDSQLLNGYTDSYHIYRDVVDALGFNFTSYDYTKERFFREKVQQFLYNSKPKVYKSLQEGNLLVKLMQVSLTPKNELGRLVYDFSATAYQIDEVSISTLNKYNFISIGRYNTNTSSQWSENLIFGQLNGFNDIDNSQITQPAFFKGGKDIFGKKEIDALQGKKSNSLLVSFDSPVPANSIAKKLHYKQFYNNKKISDFRIRWIRITIYPTSDTIQNCQPRLISSLGSNKKLKVIPKDPVFGSNQIIPLYQNGEVYEYNINENEKSDKEIYLGYLFTIGQEKEQTQIIISPPNNVYQIYADDFIWDTSIVPESNVYMTVDFLAQVKYDNNVSEVPFRIRTEATNGQILGRYSYRDENIINLISSKYFQTYTEDTVLIKKALQNVMSIKLDTEPDTLVEVGLQGNNNATSTFRVDQTGELELTPHSGAFIKSLRIIGKYYPKIDSEIQENQNWILDDGKYYIKGNDSYDPLIPVQLQTGLAGMDPYFVKQQAIYVMVFYYARIRGEYY